MFDFAVSIILLFCGVSVYRFIGKEVNKEDANFFA